MKKILVATDGSEAAAEAAEVAVELAEEHDAELIFVHSVPVVDVVPAFGFGFAGAVVHEPSAYDRALLEDAAQLAEEHGVRATTVLLRGDTIDEIVAYADSRDVDLIVVGSRGHGAIATALLGSISRGVMRESKRPVLVVRASSVEPRAARSPAGAVLTP